ncbi:sulfite exporter TauE/SafE family protein [Fusobacterium sp. PH5-44]|uniref:sulfite exporter TauE/SafE family protein n=1 Tax=unclassified Fusobacterium TaxID=2648384 RepID=UPI003D1B8E0A
MFYFLQNINLSSLIFLCIACFFAAFVDAIAGGGGLISLPAYLASGLSPHMALGTNKLSSSFGASASAIKFALSGKVNWSLLKKTLLFSFIGSIAGTLCVQLWIKPNYVVPIAIIFLTLVLFYTIVNKKIGETNDFTGLTSKNLYLGIFMALVIGFYDGFFGPGTGAFLIFALIKIFKFDFVNASGNAKFYNFASNIASLITVIFLKRVNYTYAIIVGIVMVLGSTLGAKFAVTKGDRVIKPIFITITTLVLIKMSLETFLKINVNEIIVNIFRGI